MTRPILLTVSLYSDTGAITGSVLRLVGQWRKQPGQPARSILPRISLLQHSIASGPPKGKQLRFFVWFSAKEWRVKKLKFNERCAIRILRSTNLRRKFVYPMLGSRVRTSIAIDMFLYESVYRKFDFRLAPAPLFSCSVSLLFTEFGWLLAFFYSPAAKNNKQCSRKCCALVLLTRF